MALKAVVFDLNGVIVEEAGWHRGDVQARPGIAELIKALYDAGVLLAVATSGRRATAEKTLAGLGLDGYFETVVGMEDARRPKPDPAPYAIALERLGVSPAEAIGIDDSPAGVRSARAAGLAVVALPLEGSLRWGLGGAHMITDSPAELDLATLRMLVDQPRG